MAQQFRLVKYSNLPGLMENENPWPMTLDDFPMTRRLHFLGIRTSYPPVKLT